MRMRLVTFLLLAADVGSAPDPKFKLHQYAFSEWYGKEGLPNPLLFSLVAGRDAFIWLGTAGAGLLRFDDNEFQKTSRAE